jgi:hypothetical protein
MRTYLTADGEENPIVVCMSYRGGRVAVIQPLHSFGVFTAVKMKNAVFWDMMTPCGSCKMSAIIHSNGTER